MVNLAQQMNRKGPDRFINKVDTAISDRFPRCSLLLLNGNVNFLKVNVIFGHMAVSCVISKLN